LKEETVCGEASLQRSQTNVLKQLAANFLKQLTAKSDKLKFNWLHPNASDNQTYLWERASSSSGKHPILVDFFDKIN